MIVGGVDTHADSHVAAVIDANGGILGVESFYLYTTFDGFITVTATEVKPGD
jgi:hypothetical protein